MNQLPKIGIIYLTYPYAKWELDINRCLTSLEKVNYPKDRLELICVESKGKIDSIKGWFEKTWMPKSGKELPRITYIHKDEWIGFSGNNNMGYVKAKELGCEFVHLTNEDTDVDPDYLIRAVERMQKDEKVACVQSLILLGEERDRVNTVGNAFHYLGFGYSRGYRWTKDQALAFFEEERKTNPELEIGYASGAAVLVRISALGDEQLFDEKFYSYHEDTDLSMRLRLRGLKTVVEPTSILWHYYEFGKNRMNYYWMEKNRSILIWMYYRWPTLVLLFPIYVVMDLAILLFSIKGGWADLKLKVYKDWLSSDYSKWVWERRKLMQGMRTVSDRVFLKPVVADISFQEESVKNPLLDYVGNPLLKAYWAVARRLICW